MDTNRFTPSPSTQTKNEIRRDGIFAFYHPLTVLFNTLQCFKILNRHDFLIALQDITILYLENTLRHTSDLHFIRLLLSGKHVRVSERVYSHLTPIRRHRGRILDRILEHLEYRDGQKPDISNATTNVQCVDSNNVTVTPVESVKRHQDLKSTKKKKNKNSKSSSNAIDLEDSPVIDGCVGSAVISQIASVDQSTKFIVELQNDEFRSDLDSASARACLQVKKRKLPKHNVSGSVFRELDDNSDGESTVSKRSRSRAVDTCGTNSMLSMLSESIHRQTSQLSMLIQQQDLLNEKINKLEQSRDDDQVKILEEVDCKLGSFTTKDQRRRSARIRAATAVLNASLTPDELYDQMMDAGITPGPIPGCSRTESNKTGSKNKQNKKSPKDQIGVTKSVGKPTKKKKS